MNPPTPGQKWNIPALASNVGFLSTLVGTVGPVTGTPATPTMSVHLYRLEENRVDEQKPHEQEEFYYVLSGSRTLIVGDDVNNQAQTDVSTGDLVYVPANAPHRFVGTDEIILLVFFAPNFSG